MKSKFLVQEIFFKNSNDYKVARDWKRAINFIIDYLPFTIIYNIMIENCTYVHNSEQGLVTSYANCNEEYLILFGLWVFYFLIFEGVFGRTFGKLITRTRVICSKTKKSPSFSQIVSRTFSRFIPFDLFSYLSNYPIGWHDSISGTRVVDENAVNWKLLHYYFFFGYLPIKWKRVAHVISIPLLIYPPLLLFPVIALISWLIEGFYKNK